MRNAPTFIALLLATVMTGCVVSGKPKAAIPAVPVAAKPAPTPAAPPVPVALSIPQTQVVLPPQQPLDETSLSPNTPPPPVEVVEAPAPAKPTPPRRTPATTTSPAPPVAAPPTESTPVTIQEIVPAADAKRYYEQALARRRDVAQMLDQLQRKPLNPTQRGVVTNINSFLASSLDAERRGDMKLADALADKAQILARDLVNGK